MRANKNFLRLNVFKIQLKQELSSYKVKFKVNGRTESIDSISGKSVSLDKCFFFEIDSSSQEEVVEVSIFSKKLFLIESEVGCSSISINLSKQSEDTKAWYSVTDLVNEEVVLQILLSFSSDIKSKQKILSSNYNTESNKPKASSNKIDLSYDRIFINSTKKTNGLINSKGLKTIANSAHHDESISQEGSKDKNDDQSSIIEQDSREGVRKQLNKTSSASHNIEIDEMGNRKIKSNKSIVLQNISSDDIDPNQRSVIFGVGDFDQSRILPNDFGNLSSLFDTSLLPASDNILNTTTANMSSNSLFMNNSILNNTLIPSYGIEIMKKLKKKFMQITQEKDILLKVSSDVSKNKESKCK